MEEDQVLGAGIAGHADSFEPGGVPPALLRGAKLLGGVLGVVDVDVSALGEFAEVAIHVRDAGLVVSGIDDDARGRLQAEAETPLRVVEPFRRDAGFTELNCVAAGNFRVLALAVENTDVHREIGSGHLGLQDAFQAVFAEIFGLKAEEVEMIALGNKGEEKRQALDVVPVIVGHEDDGIERGVAQRLHVAAAQVAKTCAAIEDKAFAVRGHEFEAGGVASIPPGAAVHGRGRATHSPKRKFCGLLGHSDTRR